MSKIRYILPFLLLAHICVWGQGTKQKKAKAKHLDLEFSLEGGYFDDEITVSLNSPGARIYYTLDGSKPSYKSKHYKSPIQIKETTVVRAIARRGKRKSKLRSHTYFINEPATTFPTVSIAITPEVLFDAETGLYMNGPNAVDSLWKKDGANFWSRREVKINAELFESDGNCEYNSISGFRLFGGMSRLFPQKSMTIIARDRYGKKRFRHRIFGKEGQKDFKFLVLRNSGSDWGKSHFRDALMTGLLKDWDLETQDYRPSHLYLNGKYWGIYNIREKINKYFIEDHCDVDKDSIDLIEHRRVLKLGSRKHYVKMLDYLREKDMSDPVHYARIQSMMDVTNFIDYQIAQIYFDNQDAGGNIKFWRPQTDNGRWRWILYDTDWGFGLHSSKAYKHNSLAFHTEEDGPDWPNPSWSTLILRSLLENQAFQHEFLNRFSDHMNTSFAPARVEEHIDKLYTSLKPEIDRQFDRWKLSEKNWKGHIYRMRKFGRKRPNYMRMHLMERFDTGASAELKLSCNYGGKVIINNNVTVESEKFKGEYFSKIPIRLKATPNYGYRFSHWEGIDVEEGTFEISMRLRKKSTLIRAVFEPYEHPYAGRIMINEVSANNRKSKDWVELYNSTNETVNLKGWVFTDNKNQYTLPDVNIYPNNYLILSEDSTKFNKYFKEIYDYAGEFDFGLNKMHETLGLFANDGAMIDSVGYLVPPSDSTFTIGLLLPHLDNGDQQNWEIIKGAGTPNLPNPYYLESHIKSKQEFWTRIGVSLALLLVCILVLQFRHSNRKKITS